MSEEETTTEAPQVDAVETAGIPVETPAAESEATDSDLKSRLSESDYSYVQKLREEAAGYRTERNHYTDAFDGFDGETSDAFLEAVKLIKDDPAQAHAVFKELSDALADAAGISKSEAKEIVQDAVDAQESDDSETPLTASQLEEYLAQRDTKKQEDAVATQAKAEIDEKIEALGYKPGTVKYNNLLFYATQETEGLPVDKLQAAHAKIASDTQAVIDEYLANQNASNSAFPPQSDGGAATDQASDKPKSIKSGAKAARAALDAAFSE